MEYSQMKKMTEGVFSPRSPYLWGLESGCSACTWRYTQLAHQSTVLLQCAGKEGPGAEPVQTVSASTTNCTGSSFVDSDPLEKALVTE